MKISLVTPARMQANPVSEYGNLYLDRALMSVRRQSCFADHDWEFIVGIDDDAPALPDRFSDVIYQRSGGNGQAKALNAALRLATGDIISFIEEDDSWRPHKMAVQLPLLNQYGMVTSNAREIDEYANYIRTNDFALMSGLVMARATLDRVGMFDESFKWHLDTAWLGAANAVGIKRAHVVEAGGSKRAEVSDSWLAQVSRNSWIVESEETDPLVDRLVNPKGGMSTIANDATAAQESLEEHANMLNRFGVIPW